MLRERNGFNNKITDFQLDKRLNPAAREKKKGVEQTGDITIRFVGDLKENINEVLNSLQCPEFCKGEIKNILTIYVKKIIKLREERNLFKQMLLFAQQKQKTEISRLKAKVKHLEEQLLTIKTQQRAVNSKCTCIDSQQLCSNKCQPFMKNTPEECCCLKSDYIDSSNYSSKQLHQQQPNTSTAIAPRISTLQCKQEELLISHDQTSPSRRWKDGLESELQYPQESETAKTISEEEIMKMMMKYNFSMEELQQMLDQYEVQHKMAEEMYDSQKHRNLYKLGQKMQKNIRNKKVVNDVKRLTLIKNQGRT